MARRPASKIVQTPRHAIFFFAMFILGGVVLSLAKIVNLPTGWEKIIIVFLSAALMITYAVFVTIVPATRLRLDTAADNMYYLGFLYTLTSLAVALSIDDTNQILANFGVAISSTLIGIAARVGLNQLRVDPHDIEAASRLELSEATSRIRAELDESVQQLSSFRTMNLQVLTEGYEDIQENIKRISDDIFSALDEILKKTAAPFEELAQKTTEANAKITESLEELRSSNDDIIRSNRSVVTQIDRVNRSLEGLHKHYSDTGIIDNKVISAVQEQLLLVQNKLTKEARNEFEKLGDIIKKNNDYIGELKSDSENYLRDEAEIKSSSQQETLAKEVTDSDVESAFTKPGPWDSPKPEKLKNSFAPSVFKRHKGHDILMYPNSKSYFWEGNEFKSVNNAMAAINAREPKK